MEQLSNVEICNLSSSQYLKPWQVSYSQNGKKKSLDYISEYEDVAILIYNTTRQALVFVKQFRPAIYLHNCETNQVDSKEVIDTDVNPASLGVTIELCSGIVDKNKPLQEIAQAEVLEECGYDVPLDNFKRITNYRQSFISGAKTTLFFAEVSDSMRVGQGGGLAEEGEMIEVVELSRADAKDMMMDENINRDMALVFALQWFFHHNDKS